MAVNQTTLAAYQHYTKRLYIDRDGATENSANHVHPLWQMIDHSYEDTWEGDGNAGWSVAWGRNQAVGADFTTVQGNIDNNKGDRFNFSARRFCYGFARITGEAIKATRSKVGSIEQAVKDTMDETVQTMKDRLALFLYGNGSGVIGQRSGALSGNIMTLVNPDDAKNFQKGQWIQSSGTLTGGAVRSGQAQVLKVNYGRVTSTVEFVDASLIVGFLASDFLYNASDYDAVPRGLEAWIPTSDPGASDSFLGVNRSSDNLRLAGHRLDGSGYGSLKEVAQDLGMLIGRIGAGRGQKAGFLNPIRWLDLEKDLGTKATRDPSDKATFGYDFISQQSSCGPIRWYSDPDCPTNRMYILEPKDIFDLTLGRAPHINDDDGQVLVRVSNADAVEARWRFMGDNGVRKPVKHGVAII